MGFWSEGRRAQTTKVFQDRLAETGQTGRIVGRDELSRTALGRPWNPYDRAVDMHVSNLRRKLGPTPGTRERIKTVRSSGYLLAREDGA